MSDYDKYLDAVKEQIQLNNEWSAKQAQQQMDFQERMSNTAHQREMFDLQATGLNPVLTANQGASTPSGAMAQNDGGVNAFASILSKVLDIQADNARAEMYAARSGYGSGNDFGADFLETIYFLATGKRMPDNVAQNLSNATDTLANYVVSNVGSAKTKINKTVSSVGDFVSWLFTGKSKNSNKNQSSPVKKSTTTHVSTGGSSR